MSDETRVIVYSDGAFHDQPAPGWYCKAQQLEANGHDCTRHWRSTPHRKKSVVRAAARSFVVKGYCACRVACGMIPRVIRRSRQHDLAREDNHDHRG